MDPSATAAPQTPEAQPLNLRYTGTGLDLALLLLKNLLLTVLTLGIYRPWAVTAMRRYIWGHVTFMGDRAAYLGTGKELFRGWLKLFGLLIAAVIVVKLLSLIVPAPAADLLMLPFYAVLFALAKYSGWRYRLSRTTWRQIRFGAEKNQELTHEFLGQYLKGLALVVITLGIFTPWFRNRVHKFLVNKSRFGSAYFKYDGGNGEYAGLFWGGLILSVLTAGLYAPWWIVKLRAFQLNHTHFQNRRFKFTLSGKNLLIFAVCSYVGTLMTIGLAGPWFYNWGLRLFIENIQLDGGPDLTLVQARESDGSAMADDIVTGYDLDLGF